MPSTTIDSRGAIVSGGDGGLSINTSTAVSASIQVSGALENRNIGPYNMSTTLLTTNSGSIAWGGHYSISMSNGSNAPATFVMPTIASTIGSMFIIRNINQLAHVLTGSESSNAVFTTGSLSGTVVTTSATAGSKLELPLGASVILMNTGDRFACVSLSGGQIRVTA